MCPRRIGSCCAACLRIGAQHPANSKVQNQTPGWVDGWGPRHQGSAPSLPWGKKQVQYELRVLVLRRPSRRGYFSRTVRSDTEEACQCNRAGESVLLVLGLPEWCGTRCHLRSVWPVGVLQFARSAQETGEAAIAIDNSLLTDPFEVELAGGGGRPGCERRGFERRGNEKNKRGCSLTPIRFVRS